MPGELVSTLITAGGLVIIALVFLVPYFSYRPKGEDAKSISQPSTA